jgi:4-hydroxy-tetrahydrodipicolinate synthase
LAEQIMGRGSERVRMPRLPLSGARRADVTARVESCKASRPIPQPVSPALAGA